MFNLSGSKPAASGFSFGGGAAGGGLGSTGGFGKTTTGAGGFSFGSGTSTATGTAGFGAAKSGGGSGGFSFGGGTSAAGTTGFGSTGAMGLGAKTATGGFGFGGFSGAPSSMGSGSMSGFGTSGFSGQQQQQQQQQQQMMMTGSGLSDSPFDQLRVLHEAYFGQSKSRFKHLFYRYADASVLARGPPQPPAYITPKEWEQALAHNPDPANMVPCPVVGFQELKHWISNLLDAHAKECVKQCAELQAVLNAMDAKSLQTTIKVEERRQEHQQLHHRLVKVMAKIEGLQGRQARKYEQLPEEAEYRARIERLQWLLNEPTEVKARLQELAAIQKMQEGGMGAKSSIELDRDDQERLRRFLEEQRLGLMQLTAIVKKDMRDLHIMCGGSAKGSGSATGKRRMGYIYN